MDKKNLTTLPEKPGIYLMKDAKGQVLYVGKAANLKKRLASYFRPSDRLPVKTVALLSRVHAIDTILTGTEKEALILEAAQIKKYRPRYNVILRDDKNYPLIKVTVDETWPRVVMTRQRNRDGARYFGPYVSAAAMWTVLRMLRKVFPLRRCKGREVKGRTRPCLDFQLQGCLAPCAGKVDHQVYQDMVAAVITFLEGKSRALLDHLGQAMRQSSAGLDFEAAAQYRDQIAAIQETLEKQVVVADHRRDQDIFGYVRQDVSIGLAILQVRKGVLMAQQTFYLQQPLGDDPEIMAQVLEVFYAADQIVPAEILVPFAPDAAAPLAEVLAEKRGHRVTIHVPQRGDGVRLMAMARQNASEIFVEREKRERSWQALAGEMARLFHLKRSPTRIECLDISNLGGNQTVGSLVCFTDGEADKAQYRHYRLAGGEGPDDYRMMEEVLRRRFSGDRTGSVLPDLLLVDGGKGQLNIALRLLTETGLAGEIDLLSIAKEREGEGDRIFAAGRKNPFPLKKHAPVLLFLMRIRDEAHRFGITFHRRLRGKQAMGSALDSIPGLGPARKKALLLAFGTVRRIGTASPTELAAVAGIGLELAREIHGHFHAGSTS
jgi:excinuclease ABC subunit C